MAREQRGRGREGSQQSDREEQYGGMNEPGWGRAGEQYSGGYGQGRPDRGWQGRDQDHWQDQQYGGSRNRGESFGTGGASQPFDDFDRAEQFRPGSGVGGHGAGSFGQSAGTGQFGRGGYDEGQDYGRLGRGGYGRQGFGQQDFGREQQRGYESGRQMGYTGRGPKGYRRSDDRIREDVSEELTRHPGIDATDVEVRVENGEVTLTGTVDSRRAKRMAEDCVEQCSGVRDVHNQLRVNRP